MQIHFYKNKIIRKIMFISLHWNELKQKLSFLHNADIVFHFVGIEHSLGRRIGNNNSSFQILLASGHQTTGLAVMERMEELRELALDRLYRWAQVSKTSARVPGFSFYTIREADFPPPFPLFFLHFFPLIPAFFSKPIIFFCNY